MIYMVEINFTDPETMPEWNAWYRAHLHTLLSVPGIETAQRFDAEGDMGRRFLAIYTITSPDVFTSEAYRNIGGGGVASAKWKAHIRRRRSLFSGIDIVPEITPDSRFLLSDLAVNTLDAPDLAMTALCAEALDKDPPRRHIGIVPVGKVSGQILKSVAVYRPTTERLVSPRYPVAN
ncbi:MAG: hypothetical protein ABTQ31_17865 [Rhizobiaceae bacterium]